MVLMKIYPHVKTLNGKRNTGASEVRSLPSLAKYRKGVMGYTYEFLSVLYLAIFKPNSFTFDL
jgi:hypothetical protein